MNPRSIGGSASLSSNLEVTDVDCRAKERSRVEKKSSRVGPPNYFSQPRTTSLQPQPAREVAAHFQPPFPEKRDGKMETQALTARLKYLQSSAYLLSNTAPSTSRYLLQSHNTLQFSHSINPPTSQKSQVCQACGTLFHNPSNDDEQGPVISVQRAGIKKKNGKREDKAGADAGGKVKARARALVYTCSACSRQTRIALDPQPPRRMKEKHPITSSLPSTSKSHLNPQAPTPAPSSSSSAATGVAKKRNKARKQSGLSALLSRAKATESSSGGFGLDLMDLMKKS